MSFFETVIPDFSPEIGYYSVTPAPSPDTTAAVVNTPREYSSKSLRKKKGRPLAAETKIRITMASSLQAVYAALVGDLSQKNLKMIFPGIEGNLGDEIKLDYDADATRLVTRRAVINDTGAPSKENTFRSVDEAVKESFGAIDYTFVRVTRASAHERRGPVVLKMETVMPGDAHLIRDQTDKTRNSIGLPGERPNSLFIKKSVASPRYKSDMKIYLIPKCIPTVVYADLEFMQQEVAQGVLKLDHGLRNVFCASNSEGVPISANGSTPNISAHTPTGTLPISTVEVVTPTPQECVIENPPRQLGSPLSVSMATSSDFSSNWSQQHWKSNEPFFEDWHTINNHQLHSQYLTPQEETKYSHKTTACDHDFSPPQFNGTFYS